MRANIVLAIAVTPALLGACGSSGSEDSSPALSSSTATPATTAAPTTRAPEDLRILVTNDDGYDAEGIDVVVQALRDLPNVKITVVAPKTNQSGTGSKVTDGAVTATGEETLSGFPATAVNGFPADAVAYGLSDVVTGQPDLVVAGINMGQNLGPIAAISGTVGAAKAAAAAGIPALAVSQGLADTPDFPSAADLVVGWVTAQRDVLLAGTAAADVVNLNVPTCATGTVRGVRQVPLAAEAGAFDVAPDCTSTTDAADDVGAFAAGFATATELDSDGAPVTTSTTWPPSA